MNTTESLAWIYIPICLLMLLAADGYNVDVTYVQSAVAKGAVCLDGSPPAYHFFPGFGSGVNNWLLMIKGGAWCHNTTACLARRNTPLGSSKQVGKTVFFYGILSNKQQFNPDFYNWNKVKVHYCDGSSFTGDVESVDPKFNLHYRGGRLWLAVIEDLLAKGMSKAQNVLLSGCSAGGLAVILHCDRFSSLLPSSTTVKCLSDAGFFINKKDLTGTEHIKDFYNAVVTTHGSAKNLPSSCTSKMSPGMCFFPQYVAQEISTPLFLLNAAYDSWQIPYILAPEEADPHGTWHDCKFDITRCSSAQLQTIQGYRSEFLSALAGLGTSSTRGTFINSRYTHCQAEMQETWLSSESPLLGNITIAKAVGDWYFDRQNVQLMDDCPHPFDKTCHEKSRTSLFTNANHSHHFIL